MPTSIPERFNMDSTMQVAARINMLNAWLKFFWHCVLLYAAIVWGIPAITLWLSIIFRRST